MGASATLLTYAKARETAYLQYGRMTGKRAKALTKIRQVADFHSQKSDEVQLKAVYSVRAEILELLPHENSRYQKQRKQLLTLLDQSKSLRNHGQPRNQIPTAPHGRPARSTGDSAGAQLRLI